MNGTNRPHLSLEPGSELANKAIDNVRKIFEHSKDWITERNLRLGERYLKGDIELLIHLASQTTAHYSTHFCAAFRNRPGEREGMRRTGSAPATEPDGHQPDDCFFVDKGGNEQEFVLVGNVEFVQFPEIINASLVRLGSFDDIYRSRAHSLYFSAVSHFAFGSTIENRKRIVPRDSFAVGRHQMTHKMIESAAQIVDCVPSDQRQLDWRVAALHNPIDVLQSLRIVLDVESVWVGFLEGMQGDIKLTDVVLGPFNFRPNLP